MYILSDMKTPQEIKAVIVANMIARRPTYAGLTQDEIVAHNRALMGSAPSEREYR